MKDLIQHSTPIDRQLQVAQVQAVAETWSPQHVLSWAFQTFGKKVAVSSAFGAEGMVLIDMAQSWLLLAQQAEKTDALNPDLATGYIGGTSRTAVAQQQQQIQPKKEE